jgi:hypothetical protein
MDMADFAVSGVASVSAAVHQAVNNFIGGSDASERSRLPSGRTRRQPPTLTAIQAMARVTVPMLSFVLDSIGLSRVADQWWRGTTAQRRRNRRRSNVTSIVLLVDVPSRRYYPHECGSCETQRRLCCW